MVVVLRQGVLRRSENKEVPGTHASRAQRVAVASMHNSFQPAKHVLLDVFADPCL